MNVLITGATGNVGLSVIKKLNDLQSACKIFAGVRNLAKDTALLKPYLVSILHFDFEATETFQSTLKGIDLLFLLRPPQLSNVSAYFKPLIDAAIANNVQHIIFLSVQGVENSTIIPHYKIEQLITDSKINFTFLRPAYFMQNFTTTLRNDLLNKKRVYLPAGKAKFTIIDVNDIGEVAAIIIGNPKAHVNKSYELTNNELLSFEEMTDKISKGSQTKIKYISPNLLQFYYNKRKEGVAPMFILVMIMLHYLPRFQKPPKNSRWVKTLTGHEPISFDRFVQSNLKQLR